MGPDPILRPGYLQPASVAKRRLGLDLVTMRAGPAPLRLLAIGAGPCLAVEWYCPRCTCLPREFAVQKPIETIAPAARPAPERQWQGCPWRLRRRQALPFRLSFVVYPFGLSFRKVLVPIFIRHSLGLQQELRADWALKILGNLRSLAKRSPPRQLFANIVTYVEKAKLPCLARSGRVRSTNDNRSLNQPPRLRR